MSERVTGTVKCFDESKGFGFLQQASGADVFSHYNAIQTEGDGFRTFQEGKKVEFNVIQAQKGQQAEKIAAI